MTNKQLTTTQEILALLDQDENRFLEIGRALLQLKDTSPSAFSAVVSTEKLGRRRAYYLLEITEAFDDKPYLHEQLRRIGWTKAAVVAKYASAPDIEDLLRLAEEISTFQLQSYLKQGPAGLGGRVLVFAFGADAYADLAQILKDNGAYESPVGWRNKEAALLNAIGAAHAKEGGEEADIGPRSGV